MLTNEANYPSHPQPEDQKTTQENNVSVEFNANKLSHRKTSFVLPDPSDNRFVFELVLLGVSSPSKMSSKFQVVLNLHCYVIRDPIPFCQKFFGSGQFFL